MGRLTPRERALLADMAWAAVTVLLCYLFLVGGIALFELAGDGWWSL